MQRATRTVLAAAIAMLAAAFAASPAAASSLYESHQVVVKYRADASAGDRHAIAARLGLGATLERVPRIGATVLRVNGDPAVAAARLERSSLVAYAEPNFILSANAVPNDPLFGQLYGLDNTGQTGGTPDADIDAPEGWSAAGLSGFPSSGGVKVGVVDTGIKANHEDLAGKLADCGGAGGVLSGGIQDGKCTDGNGHGTHVSGTIAAVANNGKGVAGVAFNSQVAMCRALNRLGTGSTTAVANCIIWLHDRGAKVISMSLGGGASSTLKQAGDYAWDGGSANGSVLVAAAGNDGNGTLSYPAAYNDVVSVAATDDNDQRASFSNMNADVEIAAPGVNVLSTWKNGGYTQLSGTSMATPHVAGVTAIIRDRYPAATAAQIVAKLDAAIDDLGAPGWDSSYGYGRVNLYKAATG